MNSLERLLKEQLEKQPNYDPSDTMDEKIISLIAQSDTIKLPQNSINKPLLSTIAASFLIFLIFIIPKKDNAASDLTVVFQESFRLEQEIKGFQSRLTLPVAFIQANKINQHILELDKKLQLELIPDDNEEKVLALMQVRIQKLKLLRELYQEDKTIYRI